ncbi:hypothetical protein NST77_21995 [Niallia sp. FSL W8-0177]|jgi:hypothetical protein
MVRIKYALDCENKASIHLYYDFGGKVGRLIPLLTDGRTATTSYPE